jgi:hypothetical protein
MAGSIDERIADIEELDQIRGHARALRQQAVEALTAEVYLPRPRKEGTPRWRAWKAATRRKRKDWREPGDDVEKAMMLRALHTLSAKQPTHKEFQKQTSDGIRKDLLATKLADCYKTKITNPGDSSLDNVPIMRCAMVLQVLGVRPDRFCDGHLLQGSRLKRRLRG